MTKSIRDEDNPPHSMRDELLRLAASIDDIDPRLARKLRDAADAARDLADALERAAASLNRAARKPLR